MRFKITVRGDGNELRGYMTVDSTLTLNRFANDMTPYGVVVASAVADDFDPFAISEPDHPPTIQGSREIVEGILDGTMSRNDAIDYLAQLHFAQANVIRGERWTRERAEAELRDRELHHFEVEAENERLKEELRVRREDRGA